jgi:predicted lipoprotein with Yx(FWY)xxD motif
MGKTILALSLGLLASTCAQAASKIDLNKTFECRASDCKLICKGDSGATTTQVESIKRGQVLITNGGVTVYTLDKGVHGMEQVVVPAGANSCSVSNISG